MLVPGPSVEIGALIVKAVGGVKQSGVVGHVEHADEAQAPLVAVLVRVADEHRMSPVDSEGDLCVSAGPKQRQSARVRIEQQGFLGCERETACWHVSNVPDDERQASLIDRRATTREA